MQTITINIKNDSIAEKILCLLEHFRGDEVEISKKEVLSDLELLQETRDEESISFEKYLEDEN